MSRFHKTIMHAPKLIFSFASFVLDMNSKCLVSVHVSCCLCSLGFLGALMTSTVEFVIISNSVELQSLSFRDLLYNFFIVSVILLILLAVPYSLYRLFFFF